VPGSMNQKNFALSPAATDLGLGDLITQQLEDEEAERKKKALQAAQQPQALGPATMSLFSAGGAP
jgi:hypothetical protein